MPLRIELPDDVEAALNARAASAGLSAEEYARKMLSQAVTDGPEIAAPPLKTGRGLLAKYGPAPSAEEIDANRAEMFRNFPRDDP